jgi:chromosomal replication initiator protein
LAPPGPAARKAILQQLAVLKSVDLPESVAEVLAEGLAGTAPELAGALLQLAAPAGFDGEPIELENVKQYLCERSGNRKQPTMHEIAVATARHFRLRLSELRSSVRRRALVTARGVAVYLARNIGGKSLQEIGHYFGGRDHSTVMHSCRKTEEMSASDPAIHEALARLKKELWKT